MNKKTVVIIGITSDIGRELAKRYSKEGHSVVGTYRTEPPKRLKKVEYWWLDLNSILTDNIADEEWGKWDILIFCPAIMTPIGKFFDINFGEWENTLRMNTTQQLRILHKLFKSRKKNSIVIFFAGSGTNSAPVEYSAYCLSKIMLIKMTELLAAETPDTRFVIIGPGWVKTKIHNQHPKSKKKAVEYFKKNRGTSFDQIFNFIQDISSFPIKLVNGKNFSVYDKINLSKLNLNNDLYKLRRKE